MLKVASLVALIVASAWLLPGPASVRTQVPAPAPSMIDRESARRIAWRYGLIHVEEMALENGRWEIAGRTSDDDEISIDIDAKSGALLR